MKSLCFNFIMHIPYSLKKYRFFDIGDDHYYFDDMQTEEEVSHMVEISYHPLCETLLDMIHLSKQRFRCALTVSGCTIELFEQYAPHMIDLLKSLAHSGCVEFLVTPYSYSLVSEYNTDEYLSELNKQQELMVHLFDTRSSVVCNPELLYNDSLAMLLKSNGYKGILTEGAKHLLSWKSPNHLYSSVVEDFPVLLRNFEKSNEISFHFSDTNWPSYPFDAESFVAAIANVEDDDYVLPLFFGADTFGYLQRAESGIFAFLRAIPYFAMEDNVTFISPSQLIDSTSPNEMVSALHTVSWSGETKDLSSFIGNDLQQEYINKIYGVSERVQLCKDNRLKNDWLVLQDISYLNDLGFDRYINSHYTSNYEAFISYMNIVSDFLLRVREQYPTTVGDEELNELLKTIRNQEEEILKLRAELDKMRKKKS